MIANTYSSTHATDAFLSGALGKAAREFGLKYTDATVRSKSYLSELAVHVDGSLSKLNPKLTEFAEKLSKVDGFKGANPFEVAGINFWSDVSASALKVAPFSLERRVNVPFSENRYYSKAPFHTNQHLAFLQEFEQLLASV